MSEASGKYTIKIKTENDPAGAKEAAADLDKVGQAAKNTGDKLSIGLAPDAFTKATGPAKDLGKEAEEKGEKFKLFSKHALGNREVISSLNQIFPETGALVHALGGHLVAAFAGGVIAIGLMKEALADLKTVTDAMGDGPGAKGEWAEQIRLHLVDATAQAAVFQAQLEKIFQAEQTLDEQAAAALALDKERASAQQTIASAKDAAARAEIELQEKLGNITHEQAIKIKLELDEASFKRDLDAKMRDLIDQATVKAQESAAAQNAAPGLAQNKDSARAAAEAADAAKTRNDNQISNAQKNLDSNETRQKQIEKELEDRQHAPLSLHLIDRIKDAYIKKLLRQEQDELESSAGGFRTLIDQGKSRQPGLATNAALTKSAADDAADKEKKNDEEWVASDREFDKLNSQIRRLKTENEQLLSLHNAAAQSKARGEEFDAANRRIQGEEKEGFPNTRQGESDYAVAQAHAVADAAQHGRTDQSQVHTALSRVTAVLAEHVTRTEADRNLLHETQTTLQNLESRMNANIGHH